jgi:hypothetical protein
MARATLLAACAIAVVLLAWDTFAAPRFDGAVGWQPQFDSQGSAVITYVRPGFPAARAGLRVGDILVSRVGSIAENVANRRSIVGRPIFLPVLRNGKHLVLTATPIPNPITATFWLNAALNFWLIVFATIIALRSTDLQTRLLSWIVLLLALSNNLTNGGDNGFVSPWPWLNEFVYLVASSIVNFFSVALLAFLASSFARPTTANRRTAEVATYAAAGVALVVGAMVELDALVPLPDSYTTWVKHNNLLAYWLIMAAPSFLAAICAGAGVAAARGSERQRAAWVLIPVGSVYFVQGLQVVLTPFTGGYWTGWDEALNRTVAVLSFLAPLALTYAVVKRRLLDVTFVVNRAAVFSVGDRGTQAIATRRGFAPMSFVSAERTALYSMRCLSCCNPQAQASHNRSS